jgi:hypothetical protein
MNLETDHLDRRDARAVEALTDLRQLHLSPRHWGLTDDSDDDERSVDTRNQQSTEGS